MKIAAVIDDFNRIDEQKTAYIQKIRQQTQCDFLIAVMCGDFLQNGAAASGEKYNRAKQALKTGVDVVVELPVFAALNSMDTYAFSAISLLEKLGCVQELAIACHTEDTALLEKISMFLFIESKEYQGVVKKYRSEGMEFYDAQAKAVGQFIPGAESLLQHPDNIRAAEFAKQMKRMYSTMKSRFIYMPGEETAAEKRTVCRQQETDKKLLEIWTDLFFKPQSSEEKKILEKKLNETFGGTVMLTEKIMEKLFEGIEAETLNEFAESLSSKTRSAANIRCYLLNTMIGLRKADIAVCGLYSYAVFGRILSNTGRASDLIAMLKDKAWTPVFTEYSYKEANTGKAAGLDDSKQILAGLDEKAHRLYLKCMEDASLKERTAEIERSIIKKFRKSVWRKFTKAVTEYDLIHEGDKIAVCISGGKDSMLMAKLMQEIKRHGKFDFELVFLCMNPGYNQENWDLIQHNAKILGIPLTVFESNIFDTVVDIEKSPCYLCARMRRGYLYSRAKELGCNKIALGHHFDDMIETILMGMFYSGKIETMMPKLPSQHFEGMELIRPMYMIKEADIKAWCAYNDLRFIQCACRFTEHCATEEGQKDSKREEMKRLIAHFREESDLIDKNIFRSVHDINLKTVIGYHKGDMVYNFLDDYEENRKKIQYDKLS